MFRHLLLPLTGTGLDAEAIRQARAIAVCSGADVHLMYVLEPPEQGPDAQPVDTLVWHARRLEAEAYLERAAEELRGAGATVVATCYEGKAAEHIVHHSHQDIDLMILPTGESGRERVGVLARQVLWRTFVSTLLVRGDGARAGEPGAQPKTRPSGRVVPPAEADGEPEAPREGGAPGEAGAGPAGATLPELYHTVLVALDGSKRAECVLPVVRFLAQACGARVVLGHVVQEPALPRLVPPTPEETELVERLMAVNESAAADYLLDVEARLGFGTDRRLVRGRSIVAALHKMIEAEGADLVVLAAHGYSAEPAFPFGGVAANIIGHGSQNLLVIQDAPWTERAGPTTGVTDEAWGR